MKTTAAMVMIMGLLVATGARAESDRPEPTRIETDAYGNLVARGEEREVEFRPGGMRLNLNSRAATIGFRLQEIRAARESIRAEPQRAEARPIKSGDSIVYPRVGGVQETYRTSPAGVTQVFLLDPEVAVGAETVTIAGELDGTLSGERGHYSGAATFYAGDRPALSYGPALAIDARGRRVPVEIQVEGNRVALEVSGSWLQGAEHPIRIESDLSELTTMATIPISTLLPKSIEDMPVWRAQIRLVTYTVDNAGTDDHIQVKLNSTNVTALDYDRDDFERGSDWYYDLSLTGIRTLRDITNILISKTGSDGWCLKSFALYVNGIRIYDLSWGSGRWFDNGSTDTRTLLIPSSTLRSHVGWLYSKAPAPPSFISFYELQSMIVAEHGDAMYRFRDDNFKWGAWIGYWPWPMGLNGTFDLYYKQVRSYLPDQYIHQEGAIVSMGCTAGVMSLPSIRWSTKTGSVESSFSSWTFGQIAAQLKYRLDAINRAKTNNTVCPTLKWGANGDLSISWP